MTANQAACHVTARLSLPPFMSRHGRNGADPVEAAADDIGERL
jgi:hypothetical protein